MGAAIKADVQWEAAITSCRLTIFLPQTRALLIWSAIGLAITLQIGCEKSGEIDTPPASSLHVKTQLVKLVPGFTETLHASGYVVASDSVSLAFEFSGKIESIEVDQGDKVSLGQVLAKQDQNLLEAEIDVLKFELAVSEAKLQELVSGPRDEVIDRAREEAEAYLPRIRERAARIERYVRLVPKGSVPLQELEQIQAEKASLERSYKGALAAYKELENGTRKELLVAQRAQVGGLKAKLNETSIRVDKSSLIAPFNAAVSRRMLDSGAVASANQPVLELLSVESFEAVIGVPASDAIFFKTGQEHELSIGEHVVVGTVKSVLPQVDLDSRTATVVFQFVSNHRPMIGRVAKLTVFNTHPREGFWIPVTSLSQSFRGLWSCFVVTENMTVERVDVEVLLAEQDRVFVSGELRDGERIVSAGLNRIVKGQKVEFADE